MEEKVIGYIDHFVYRNEENGYTVLLMQTEDGEELTCVGTFQYLSQGETIEARGNYIEHHTYGKQFQIESYEAKAPEDSMAMERYLGSGAIKGLGTALAARIVRRFKEDTLRIIEEEPERLSEVKGISQRMAREIGEQIAQKADMRNAMMFLQQYGISLTIGAKIFKHYGQEMYGVLRDNPYKMADDIPGVGFKMADDIAGKLGIAKSSDYRISSGLVYVLTQAAQMGHTYLPEEELYERTANILQVPTEGMKPQLMNLAVDRKVVLREIEGNLLVYSSQLYHLELDTARMLWELNQSGEI